MKKKKYRGIEQLKSRYGWLFISTWLVGVILFFAIPVIQSVIYSFSQMTVNEGGIKTLFVGMKNYKYIIAEHTDYLGWLRKSVTNFLYSLPIIVLLSLVLALLLNNKFKGRLFFQGAVLYARNNSLGRGYRADIRYDYGRYERFLGFGIGIRRNVQCAGCYGGAGSSKSGGGICSENYKQHIRSYLEQRYTNGAVHCGAAINSVKPL